MSKSKNNSDGVVYSTDKNFVFPVNEDENAERIKHENQQLKIFLDRLGGGKLVSRIAGFVGSENDKEELATTLKKYCGVGGSVKENDILIQGNHREKIVVFLSKKGFKVKIAGG